MDGGWSIPPSGFPVFLRVPIFKSNFSFNTKCAEGFFSLARCCGGWGVDPPTHSASLPALPVPAMPGVGGVPASQTLFQSAAGCKSRGACCSQAKLNFFCREAKEIFYRRSKKCLPPCGQSVCTKLKEGLMAAPSFFGVKDDFLTPNGPHIGRQWEGNLPSLWDFFFQSLTGSMILSGLGGGH